MVEGDVGEKGADMAWDEGRGCCCNRSGMCVVLPEMLLCLSCLLRLQQQQQATSTGRKLKKEGQCHNSGDVAVQLRLI